MSAVRLCLATLCMTALLSVAAAPASEPATRPASSRPVVVHGAVEALAVYNRAMMAGDEKGMFARIHAEGDDQLRVARATVRADLAIAGVIGAAVARFGDGAAESLHEAMDDLREQDIGDVRVTGEDKVTLLDHDGNEVLAAVRVGGVWKLHADDGGDPDALREMLDGTVRTQARCRVLRQDLEAGRYESLAAFVRAVEAAFAEG